MKKAIFTIVAATCILVSNIAQAQTDSLLASIIKIVSPVEISDMIRRQGIAYDNTILNKATNVPKYTTPYKQALNLGIFSTDLGYATINDKSSDALTYITQVKTIAKLLKVEQFINMSKIMQLAMNKSDMNKLLDETSSTFENISDHLEKQKKPERAALMLSGGWLETLYITCEVAKTKLSPELSDRIIGQKIVLAQILDVLKPHTKDAEIKKLFGQLTELNKIFDAYKFEEATAKNTEVRTKIVKNEQGEEVVETVSVSTTKDVNLTTDDLAKILGKVSEIRKGIIE